MDPLVTLCKLNAKSTLIYRSNNNSINIYKIYYYLYKQTKIILIIDILFIAVAKDIFINRNNPIIKKNKCFLKSTSKKSMHKFAKMTNLTGQNK